MAADGSIIIDTRIDTSGVSDGSINIKQQFSDIGKAARKVSDEINGAFNGVKTGNAAAGMSKSFDVEGDKIQQILSDTERSAKSKAASIAAIYRKQGDTQQEAFKKAWAQIERTSGSGSKKVKKDLDGIGKKSKSVGSDLKSNLTSGLSEAFRRLAGIIAGAFAVHQVAEFAKSCLDLGSDLQEVQNVVDVTFTTMNEQVNAFAQNAVNTAGLSETMAKRYAGTFGAMSKAFGFAESEAFAMSTALTQLAGDVASFYNITQDEAYTKLKSVFTGETESLKDLGVVMTQAALDSYALANGYGKTTAAMSEQEKVALRYAFVMDQLTAASGDFLRTSDGWANQTRVLALQFEQLKATIGQGLINALTPVIKVINTILAGLMGLAKAFAQFTSLLFGNAVSVSGGGAQEELAGIADGYEAAAGGAEDLAKGTEKAGKAAKKYLAGFDEIQKLGSNETSGGGGSGGAGSGVGGIGDFDFGAIGAEMNLEDNISPQVEAMVAKIRELIAPLQEIDFTPLKASLGRLGEAFGDLGGIILDNLEWAWFNILVPLAKWTIEDAAPAVVTLLASAFEFLAAVLRPVFDGLQKLLKWLEPVFKFIGDTAVEVLGWFSEAFDELAAVFEEKGPEISGIFSNIGEVIAAVWAVIEPLLSDMVDVFGECFDWIMEIVVEAVEWIIDALYGLTEFIAGIFTGDWSRAWQGIETIFESTGEFLVEIAEWILKSFGLSFGDIAQAAKSAWDNIKTTTTSIWNGIKSTVKGAINGIIGSINGMIRGMVSGINSVIRSLNKLSFKIPDWVPSFGGKSFGFNLKTVTAPQIPYLAKGAVIPPNAPFMAVLGDQRHGTNIEAPLATIEEAVANVMSRMNGVGNAQVIALLQEILEAILGIEIDGETLSRAVNNYKRRIATAKGGSL